MYLVSPARPKWVGECRPRADEPTANLAAKRGHEVTELLRRKALETNKAVVIVSHDHRIRDIADRVVRLEDGRLQADS